MRFDDRAERGDCPGEIRPTPWEMCRPRCPSGTPLQHPISSVRRMSQERRWRGGGGPLPHIPIDRVAVGDLSDQFGETAMPSSDTYEKAATIRRPRGLPVRSLLLARPMVRLRPGRLTEVCSGVHLDRSRSPPANGQVSRNVASEKICQSPAAGSGTKWHDLARQEKKWGGAAPPAGSRVSQNVPFCPIRGKKDVAGTASFTSAAPG